MSSFESKFDGLLRDYRDACPEPAGSLGFVPGLWRRIESQKSFLRRAKGWTSAYVTAAAALCLILVILISLQAGPLHQNYIDILDDDSNDSASAVVEASAHSAAPGAR